MGCPQRKAEEQEKEMGEGGREGRERKGIAHCRDFDGSVSLQP